jgi:hypothetical protein
MNNKEIKYIIVRDRQTNKLRHFKDNFYHHCIIAQNNGYDSSEILEAGIFLFGRLHILESVYIKHLEKKQDFYVGNILSQNFLKGKYQELENFLKGRQLESQLYYSKRPVGLRDGD